MALLAASTAYRMGEQVGFPALMFVVGLVLLVVGLSRRSSAPPVAQPVAPVATYDAGTGTGIHPAAYEPGGWLEGTQGADAAPPPGGLAPAEPEPLSDGSTAFAPPVPFDPPVASPARRGRTLMVVGGVFLGLGVLSVGQTLVANATKEPPHTAALPQRLTQLERTQDSGLQAQLDTSIHQPVGGGKASVAAYGQTPDATPALIVLIEPLPDDGTPADALAGFGSSFGASNHSGDTVSAPTTVDPGPLGGDARCWVQSVPSRSVVACAWAVSGLMGVVEEAGSDVNATADRMRAVRGEIEKAG